jgi:hypothetical protein
VFLTRQNDSSPYYAGARIYGALACTTGWAINHASPLSPETTKLLTAAHCQVSGSSFTDGGGDTVGPVTNRSTSRDTEIINARGAGRMWDGPWNETSYTKAVQGATFSNIGNWLCTSGSYSGVRCNIQVLFNNQSVGFVFPLVIAARSGGGNAGGQGDSGGPVFELPGPDNGKVIAKGIISVGIDGYTTPCTGQPVTRTCYSRIGYADVTQTLNYYGATIRTG